MEQAHDSIVWSLNWHPLGHILTSGSNDHTWYVEFIIDYNFLFNHIHLSNSKFWTRNRPGDRMRDKYNLNLLPKGSEEAEYDDVVTAPSIPGMGFGSAEQQGYEDEEDEMQAQAEMSIPGLGMFNDEAKDNSNKKVPFAKPIPKQFQQQWNAMDNKRMSPSSLISPHSNNLSVNGTASSTVPNQSYNNSTPSSSAPTSITPPSLLGPGPLGPPPPGSGLLGHAPQNTFPLRNFLPPSMPPGNPPIGMQFRPEIMLGQRMPPNLMIPPPPHQLHQNANFQFSRSFNTNFTT